MKSNPPNDTVLFAAKGQVVIPAWLRRDFHIEPGTRAIVQATPDGILLKPITKQAITRLHGILKPESGDKSLAQDWADHKREETRIEDKKLGRRNARRS